MLDDQWTLFAQSSGNACLAYSIACSDSHPCMIDIGRQAKDFLKSIDQEDLIADYIPQSDKQLEKDWHDSTKTIFHNLETKVSDLQKKLAQANDRINHLEHEVCKNSIPLPCLSPLFKHKICSIL